MEGLVTFHAALKPHHSDVFSRSRESPSSNDPKRFTQIERDIIAVSAALGRPERRLAPDLQVVLERFAASQTNDFDDDGDAEASAPRRVPRHRLNLSCGLGVLVDVASFDIGRRDRVGGPG